MIDPAVIEILKGAALAAGPLIESVIAALSEDHREAVLAAIARDRAALDAAPDVLARIDAAIAAARSRVRAHEQARGETLRTRYGLTDTAPLALARARSGERITESERMDVIAIDRLVRDALDGVLALAPTARPTLPVALFGEPDHPED